MLGVMFLSGTEPSFVLSQMLLNYLLNTQALNSRFFSCGQAEPSRQLSRP